MGSDATSLYRGYGPLLALAKKYPGIEIDHIQTYREIAWHTLMKYDLLFLQRPASPTEVAIIKMCQQIGLPVWCDWDDNYFEIPDSNNRKKNYTLYHIECVKFCAKNAQVVTVSTKMLYERFSELNKNTVLIPNMLDTKMFPLTDSDGYSRDNLILWRGSDTHNENLDFYKDEIIKAMDETPDWVWGFFGYVPQWAIDHLPSHRIRIYQDQGTIEYMRMMLALRPKIVYVVHSPNNFNVSRSHIAFLEATYAGAICVTPDTQEWIDLPTFKYSGKENLTQQILGAVTAQQTHIDMLEESKQWILRHNSEHGSRRKVILDELIESNPKAYMPPVQMPEQFTDEEFFNYHKQEGWTSEAEGWRLGQEKMADFLEKELNAKSVFDLGCGSGGLLEALIKKQIMCYGVDSNVKNKEFFDKRNPGNEECFILDNATNIEFGSKFDVVTCIEVMEHIPDEVNEKLLAMWRNQCTYFLFTSTPYTSTASFDSQWGHCNVKPTDHWIKFFEKNGYMLQQRLDFPAPWALLFRPFPKQ